MDFASGKGDMGTAAQAMAGDSGKAIATGQLSAAEVVQLQGVLAGLTGDADLAAAYVGQAAGVDADSGIVSANVDEQGESGYNREGQTTEGRGKVTEIKHRPSSGAVIKAIPGKTTTILGNYKNDMQYIIGELGDIKSTDFGPNDGGFNVLNVPNEDYRGLTGEQFWKSIIGRGWIMQSNVEMILCLLQGLKKNTYINITKQERKG